VATIAITVVKPGLGADMNQLRIGHTVTLLPDGKVLAVGGRLPGAGGGLVGSNTAELYDPNTDTWTPAQPMSHARQYHTATLQPDGKVLVVGGEPHNASLRGTAEIYDPGTDIWTPTGMTNLPRNVHTATLLPDGRVLIVGGTHGGLDGPSARTAELYDPATRTWEFTGSMKMSRYSGHLASLLETGKVLVAHGHNTGDVTTELYDPDTGVWTLTGRMQEIVGSPSMTTLPDGNVLVASLSTGASITIVQFYDPVSGQWRPLSSRPSVRFLSPTVTGLFDGKILITGTYTRATELYDPSTKSWAPGGDLLVARTDRPTVTQLGNGKVLIAGATLASELYNP